MEKIFIYSGSWQGMLGAVVLVSHFSDVILEADCTHLAQLLYLFHIFSCHSSVLYMAHGEDKLWVVFY